MKIEYRYVTDNENLPGELNGCYL